MTTTPTEPFYSRNSLRSYPLVRGSDLPTTLLVDAGFTADQDTGFVPSQHPVRVTRLSRVSSGWVVTAAGPPGVPDLKFFAEDGWGEWLTVWADGFAEAGSSSSSGSGGVPAAWFGFMVFGRESDWQSYLPSGSVVPAAGLVEPARTAVTRGLVRSVRIANRTRLRAGEPYCGSASDVETPPTSSPRAYVEWPTAITSGRLELVEGHNLSARLRPGRLTLSARPGYGDGEVCEEVPVTSGETPPSGSALLTGGPACGDLVRTVNGLPGRTISVSGGAGIAVTDYPEDGVVRVSVNLAALAAWPSGSSSGGV